MITVIIAAPTAIPASAPVDNLGEATEEEVGDDVFWVTREA